LLLILKGLQAKMQNLAVLRRKLGEQKRENKAKTVRGRSHQYIDIGAKKNNC
jgi:hypothetical protein